MKVYMISGKARNGKDTLAGYLIKGLENKKVCRIQISQYIKYYDKNQRGLAVMVTRNGAKTYYFCFKLN